MSVLTAVRKAIKELSLVRVTLTKYNVTHVLLVIGGHGLRRATAPFIPKTCCYKKPFRIYKMFAIYDFCSHEIKNDRVGNGGKSYVPS